MLLDTPKFLQGVYRFEGRGLENPVSFDPKGRVRSSPRQAGTAILFPRGQFLARDDLSGLMRNDKPMRYCPLGAKGALDVGFHVIEETAPGTVLEVRCS